MSKTVLVVDDSLTMRSVLELNVKKIPGVKVALAKDYKEALEKFQAEKPALILMDINMPDMNGYELTEKIRSMEGGQNIPIVFITTRGDEGDRDRGMRLGAAAYVAKPVNGMELVATLEKLLG